MWKIGFGASTGALAMTTRRHFVTSSIALPLLAVAHPSLAHEATPTASPEKGDILRNVIYSDEGGQPLAMDIYLPAARENPRPAVILIHGGAWTYGFADRTVMDPYGYWLMMEGYIVANISYRLLGSGASPDSWPAQLDDVQQAVRWLRENASTYNIDPDRIGTFGHSSGGHLAAMLGVRETSNAAATTVSSRVNCVVAIAGAMDMFIPLPDEIIVDFLGGTPDEVPDQYRDASPISWVDGNSSPFLLLQGNADELNHVDHARLMSQALQRRGIEVVHGEFQGLDHFEVAEWDHSGAWTTAFFAKHLRPER
jgi:acetyl esterase/lipase